MNEIQRFYDALVNINDARALDAASNLLRQGVNPEFRKVIKDYVEKIDDDTAEDVMIYIEANFKIKM